MARGPERWRALPKSELHVHLHGATPIGLFAELLGRAPVDELLARAPVEHRVMFGMCESVRRLCAARRPADQVAELFRYGSFQEFLATWLFTTYLVRSAADLEAVVTSVVGGLRAQNVVYAEVTISPVEYLQQGISLDQVLSSLQSAAIPGIRVQWIVDLVRDTGPDRALALLDRIAAARCPSIVGITLGGDESRHPPEPFRDVYARARDHGLRLTVHAGEAAGPASIRAALDVLGVERIGHGVRAVEDPALVARLAEQQVPLEVCPTSNVRTGVCRSHDAHPVRQLFEAGVPITINTDDPTFFATTLADELAHVEAAGLGDQAVLEMATNGFRHAFLPPADIEAYVDRLRAAWAASGDSAA